MFDQQQRQQQRQYQPSQRQQIKYLILWCNFGAHKNTEFFLLRFILTNLTNLSVLYFKSFYIFFPFEDSTKQRFRVFVKKIEFGLKCLIFLIGVVGLLSNGSRRENWKLSLTENERVISFNTWTKSDHPRMHFRVIVDGSNGPLQKSQPFSTL